MNYAFRVFFKQPYHYLRSGEGRQFLKLCWQLGNKTRNHPVTLNFQKRKLKIADNWSFLWQFHDLFFRKAYSFQSKKKNPVIIDCGANIGLSCLFFKQYYPGCRLIAFEPDNTIYSYLIKNTDHLKGIEVHNKAVWTHSNGVNFESATSDTGRINSKSGTKVESVRLKEVINSLESVDLLKLDIEGAEFEVLADCSKALGNVQNLFVEVHTFSTADQQISGLLKILEEAGFRYFIENENEQEQPLNGNWKVSNVGMDVQLNVFATRNP